MRTTACFNAFSAAALIAILLTSFVACSSTTAPSGPHTGASVTRQDKGSGVSVTALDSRSILPSGGLAGTEAIMTEVVAKVVSVDPKTRNLTLKSQDGNVFSVKAGAEVRNLPQVRVGDSVNVAYLEAVDFEVRQPTSEELARSKAGVAVVGRAPLGAKPSGIVAAQQTKIFVVESLDMQKSLVTLKEGERLLTVRAKYPENLSSVNLGDTVVVTVSELVAADIRPLS
jgi:hypothetical protein